MLCYDTINIRVVGLMAHDLFILAVLHDIGLYRFKVYNGCMRLVVRCRGIQIEACYIVMMHIDN